MVSAELHHKQVIESRIYLTINSWDELAVLRNATNRPDPEGVCDDVRLRLFHNHTCRCALRGDEVVLELKIEEAVWISNILSGYKDHPRLDIFNALNQAICGEHL